MEEFHEAANIFPLMDEAALSELAADIAANGLREPIWRHRDGRIIDGRNRWLACQRAGVTCHAHTYQYDDASIVPFVISHNLHRRHLTTAQRAAIAADLATLPRGLTKANRPDGLSQSEAANLLNVSVKSIKRAKGLKDAAPEIHERVKSGAISAREAAAAVRERNGGTDRRQNGTPKMKARPKSDAAKKPEAPKKPEALGYLELWLRNGVRMVNELGDADQAVALADRFHVYIDPDHTEVVSDFLRRLRELAVVDRTA